MPSSAYIILLNLRTTHLAPTTLDPEHVAPGEFTPDEARAVQQGVADACMQSMTFLTKGIEDNAHLLRLTSEQVRYWHKVANAQLCPLRAASYHSQAQLLANLNFGILLPGRAEEVLAQAGYNRV